MLLEHLTHPPVVGIRLFPLPPKTPALATSAIPMRFPWSMTPLLLRRSHLLRNQSRPEFWELPAALALALLTRILRQTPPAAPPWAQPLVLQPAPLVPRVQQVAQRNLPP